MQSMLTTRLKKGGRGLERSLDPASVIYYGSANQYYPQSELKTTQPARGPLEVIKRFLNIRWIGAGLFVASLIFFISGFWVQSNERQPSVRGKLLLANVFIRHGDRAPTGKLPRGDRHAENVAYFWPNKLENLTELGKFRMYKVGLETRRKYSDYLDYDSDKILALSSPLNRCRDSMHYVLQGLYNIEWTKGRGRALVRKMNSCSSNYDQCSSRLLSKGSGSPLEWRKVKIDSETLLTLYDDFLKQCAYVKNNPSPIEIDLMESIDVRSLPGIEKLRDTLVSKYGSFNASSLGLYSTISAELNIIRTESTYNYTNHFNDWIEEVVIAKPGYVITLFDLFEQVAVFSYRDRLAGLPNHIQTGHLITSVVESQLMSLNGVATNDRMKKYKDKKMILYTSHDTVMHLILHTLHVITIDSSFEDRFSKWFKSQDSFSGLLNGLKMPSYGMSMRFELWELESINDDTKFRLVQLSIYNEDEVEFRDVDYKIVDFGTACNRLFTRKYPTASSEELFSFYKTNFQFDRKRHCPFELFRNVTSDLLISDEKVHELCNKDN